MAAIERNAATPTTVRPLRRGDGDFVLDVAVAAGMFPSDAAGFLSGMVETYLEGGTERGERMAILDNGQPLAMAYWRPVEATNGTFDLTMIAVMPQAQRAGAGATLLAHLEDDLRGRDGRLLLVNTSSGTDFDAARAFYEKYGFIRAETIDDYWDAGDDLIVFRKSL
ncbi:MAG: GNAT family N-acetyltransferase [Pseudomonadota bacterium]